MSRKPEYPTGFPTLQFRVLPKGYGDNMEEIWKDIQGYEGIYQVSNYGEVRSLDRIEQCNGTERLRKGRTMLPRKIKDGYLSVGLRNGSRQKGKLVHRLVAEAFIRNPNNLPEVNHKDENKENNSVENLEWCDAAYNIRYGTGIERRAAQIRKEIVQYSLDGDELTIFNSITEAARAIGGGTSRISACCKGERKSAYGYRWKYKEAN